jgi:hypothetical protein
MVDAGLFRKIASFRDKKAIKYVNTEISKMRLYAQKQRGYLKYYIHTEANHLERDLKKAIEIYEMK